MRLAQAIGWSGREGLWAGRIQAEKGLAGAGGPLGALRDAEGAAQVGAGRPQRVLLRPPRPVAPPTPPPLHNHAELGHCAIWLPLT